MFDKQKRVWCCKCSKEIPILYIKCAECDNLEFCLQCFSSGAEVDGHLKSHQYIIVDNGAFSLFDSSWSAEEEHMLVDSVEQYGLGNWDEVAFNIPGKTAKEVEDHYMVVYVEGDLGRLTVPSDLPNKITDHSPFIHDSSLPALPQVHISKQQQHELAYMPNRDDYEFEFDNEAESVLSALAFAPDDTDLDRSLKLAQVNIYHAKLMERQRRKDVSREYHLVEKFFRKDKSLLQTKFEKETRLKLRCCSQFMKTGQFEKIIKGFLKERHLKRKIAKLKNYRKNGLTKFEGCSGYDSAVYRRDKLLKDKEIDDAASGDNHDQASASEASTRLVDIRGQAEYHLLGNGERRLCVSLKMTPARYLTAKVLIVKDAVLKQHSGQTKSRYSSVIEKSQRRRILSYLKENSWLS